MNPILHNRDFLLLWQGQVISQTGTHVFNIVRIYWIVENVEEVWLVGVLLTLCSLTITLISPIGGYFADHYSRKRIIIFSDFFSALLMLILAVMMFSSEVYTPWQLIGLFSVSILVSVSTSFFNPAIMASIPAMVEKRCIAKANSWLFSAGSLAQIVGQGIGGWLMVLFSTPVLLIVNGVSFLISAISESFINFKQQNWLSPKTISKVSVVQESMSRLQHFRSALSDGFGALKSDNMAWMMVIYSALSAFLFLPLFVLSPFLARDVFGGGSVEYGYFIAALSTGMLFGNVYIMIVQHQRPFTTMLFWVVVIRLTGFFLVGMGLNLIAAIVGFFFIGMAMATENVLITTHLQQGFEPKLLGRIMGFSQMLSASLAPIAFLGAGLLVEWAPSSVRGWYIASPLITLVIFALFVIKVRLSKEKTKTREKSEKVYEQSH